MQDDIDRVLIDRRAIAARVRELAARITADLCRSDGSPPSGRRAERPADPAAAVDPAACELTLIPILTGSFIFAADLIRHLPLMLQIRLISISSYPGTATASRGAQLKGELSHLPASLAGAHMLLIDDILDSGRTLTLAADTLRQLRPASLRTCVLLRKRRPAALAVPVDYVAFDIPDEFVVGYGLDFNDYYRNLPDIVTLRSQVVEAARQAATPDGQRA